MGRQIQKEIAKITLRYNDYLILVVLFTIISLFLLDRAEPILGANVLPLAASLGTYLIPIIIALGRQRGKINGL